MQAADLLLVHSKKKSFKCFASKRSQCRLPSALWFDDPNFCIGWPRAIVSPRQAQSKGYRAEQRELRLRLDCKRRCAQHLAMAVGAARGQLHVELTCRSLAKRKAAYKANVIATAYRHASVAAAAAALTAAIAYLQSNDHEDLWDQMSALTNEYESHLVSVGNLSTDAEPFIVTAYQLASTVPGQLLFLGNTVAWKPLPMARSIATTTGRRGMQYKLAAARHRALAVVWSNLKEVEQAASSSRFEHPDYPSFLDSSDQVRQLSGSDLEDSFCIYIVHFASCDQY